MTSDRGRAAIDKVVGEEPIGWSDSTRAATGGRVARGGAALRARRNLLLPALQAVQQAVGWVTPDALDYLGEKLGVAPADAYGVTDFYDLLRTSPGPKATVRVCTDIACVSQVSGDLGDGVEVEPVSCLGHCALGSAALVEVLGQEDVVVAPATTERIRRALDGDPPPVESARVGGDVTLLARIGVVDPASLADYREHGGYRALRKAMEVGPTAVVEEVEKSGLTGRGGASFPTGRKWAAVAGARAVAKYVICNADESEPGTFKDRIVLENDPFAVIEALTIAAFAVGATKGFVYVRGEYPRAHQRVQEAVFAAREAGLLGEGILGSDFSFEIEIRKGGGAYICGEETALFNSIEGFRGEPRSKPPFPTEAGLFGAPTVINNVETLANIPSIILDGGEAFAATGRDGSTGTKLFSVSGRVAKPGLYEVACCATLGELIELAGGAIGTFRAALVGGAAGSFMGPDRLGDEMSTEYLKTRGESLGSGAIVVFDETSDMEGVVRRITEFFRNESCGQCVPCRVGTVVQERALAALLEGDTGQRQVLSDVDRVMTDASICGLGRTAASAVRSALRLGLIGGAS